MILQFQPRGSDPLSEFTSEAAVVAPPARQIVRTPAPPPRKPPQSASPRPGDSIDAVTVLALAVVAGAAGYAAFLLTR